jgi:hypothetical protein
VKQVAGRAFRSSAFFRRAYIIYGDSLSAPSKGGAEPFLNREGISVDWRRDRRRLNGVGRCGIEQIFLKSECQLLLQRGFVNF